MAQTPTYPKNIFFFCKSASETGGETPLCRSDQLYEALLKADKALVESFEKFGVIYNSIMSSGDELISGQGRSWQKTLGVSSKNGAEAKLSKLGYSWNWIEGDNLSVTTKTLEFLLLQINYHPQSNSKNNPVLITLLQHHFLNSLQEFSASFYLDLISIHLH